MGFALRIVKADIEESYSKDLKNEAIPLYLATQKGKAYKGTLADKEILLCSDTMVFYNNIPLGKPKNEQEAFAMLKMISGNTHYVVSACYIKHKDKELSFAEKTKVKFKQLSDDEITYYIKKYQPFDKAGAYGIQEWIGMIGIEAIEGDYYNVMGLPTVSLFAKLKEILC